MISVRVVLFERPGLRRASGTTPPTMPSESMKSTRFVLSISKPRINKRNNVAACDKVQP